MQIKSGKYEQLLIKDGGPFVPLDSILESITVCKVLHGGTVKDAPVSLFLCHIFSEREREATPRTVQWNCRERL